jgi:hypothetical protein
MRRTPDARGRPVPQSIPPGLPREHVLLALADLDAGESHPFGTPTRYELVFEGKRYAPKAVVGLAYRLEAVQTSPESSPIRRWGGSCEDPKALATTGGRLWLAGKAKAPSSVDDARGEEAASIMAPQVPADSSVRHTEVAECTPAGPGQPLTAAVLAGHLHHLGVGGAPRILRTCRGGAARAGRGASLGRSPSGGARRPHPQPRAGGPRRLRRRGAGPRERLYRAGAAAEIPCLAVVGSLHFSSRALIGGT